ncbi:hypothetical protein CMK20_15655 [Candidatus Poribacteria bacterium]|nr:hypothetical protein [Candidatus Poribacteria bacterium]MCH2573208.1 HlyD family efflux transporter periplasmic adaptor subunit [Candidatus Poribacteria bacterium]|tara:strand:+ start:330 stop:2306 length:1977 start_codon:yes stop_codon:yes gene_type:complete
MQYRIWGVILVAFILVSTGCDRIPIRKKKQDTEDKTEMARTGEFRVKIRETGNLEPLISVEVKSNVSGEIEQLLIEEGDYVEKGQELLRLDDEQVSERRKQAQANLGSSRASLEQARSQTFLTEKRQSSDIQQLKNTVKSAEASLASVEATATQQLSSAQTDIERSRNMLEQDRIALSQAKITLQQADIQLEQNQANESSAKIEFDNVSAEYERQKDLYTKKYVSKKSLEDAELRLSQVKSSYQTAQKNVTSQTKSIESQKRNIEARDRAIANRQATIRLQEQNLGTIKTSQEANTKRSKADLESAKIRLQQALETVEQETSVSINSEIQAQSGLLRAESALQSIDDELGWTVVKAPLSGRVTRLAFEEGEIVMGSRSGYGSQGPAILVISDLSKMVVKTRINEAEISKVALGQQAEITIDAYPNLLFSGEVTEIAPSANTGQGSSGVVAFEVVIEIATSEYELLPGMSANVDIIVFDEVSVLQLPIEAVIVSEMLTANVTVSNVDLGLLVPNQSVTLETLVGEKYESTVGKINANIDRHNVEVLLDKNSNGLRVGPTSIHLTSEGKFDLRDLSTNIEAERKYFVQLDDLNAPKLKKDKTKKRKRKKDKIEELKGTRTRVEVGQRNNTHFEITSGISSGAVVYVPSLDQLTRDNSSKR